MNKEYKPKDMPDMIPYLVIQDAEKTINFYQNALGFELINKVTDEQNMVQHVEMRRGEIVIMFCPESACQGMGMETKAPISIGIEEAITLYCYCENVDDFYKNAIAHGAKSLMPPQDQFWEDRMCTLLDINGYKWSFATHVVKKKA